jgi:hypothetical protein
MVTRTTIRLPDDLMRSAKRTAAAEGSTFTALVEEGLRAAIARRSRRPKPPRIPVSTATGGFSDWTNVAQTAQELEDLDYIERLRRGFE